MSRNDMEVKITLTPLGKDEIRNHRTIAITANNPSVIVGRASKNPNKGLLATPDNAWFDYPILSRTHAKFTASRDHQQIYVQDCRSTHGTYLDKRRLEPNVQVAVAEGGVITFGQRVTSGAVTYPAKEFRVHSKWESPSEIARMRAHMHATSMSRPTFTNDFDYSSEPSREGSIQIVESHRHTFSVPSSGDETDSDDEEDDVQIASSAHGDEEEISAATTPDRQAVGKTCNNAEGSKTEGVPSEIRSLTQTSSKLLESSTNLYKSLTSNAHDGTSQQNPIHLGGICTKTMDLDTESEDDGPDVFPFYESSGNDQLNQSKSLDEPQAVCQASTVKTPMIESGAGKKRDQSLEIQGYNIVPETQAKESNRDEVRAHSSPSVRAESATGATDDLESEDDDGFDHEHEHDFFTEDDLDQYPQRPCHDFEISTGFKPKVPFQIGNEKPHHKTLTPPFDEFRPAHLGRFSVSDPIDVSQSAEPLPARTQRPPSPSDAALARKWPAACTTEQTTSIVACHEEPIEPFPWPELQSPEPRLYDQGPFSSHAKTVVPTLCSPRPRNLKTQSRKATVTWADTHEDECDLMLNSNRFAETGKASKITIPSLVENYFAENPRSFKRKYGGIDGSNDVESASRAPKFSSPVTRTSGYKRTFAEANTANPSYPVEEDSVGTQARPDMDPTDSLLQPGEDNTTQRQHGLCDQDTPLPDAQPRENILQTLTASTSQDSVPGSVFGAGSLTTPISGHDAEGPARKRTRTSSSSSGGIGKFVMGVGFGLLGAAAAFIATIPASVYDEALREFSNAA